MKVAILQCDNVLEKFQSRFGDYPDMVARMFVGRKPPFSFHTYDCRRDNFPEDIDAFDFYITTGSKATVYDNDEWIQKTIRFIQKLDSNQKKCIGICFGHQLMAMACGGKVEKSEKGWGVGVAENPVMFQPVWMREAVSQINILASHQDQIITLPANTEVIAGNDFCPFFVVQWGRHFLSIQGHPEWNTEYSRTLINDRRAIIDKATSLL